MSHRAVLATTGQAPIVACVSAMRQPDGYRVDTDGCTGCGVCAGADAAVTVERLPPSPQTFLPLVKHRCRGCGIEVRLPAARAGADLCPVCDHDGHHRRLFQVLD